LRRWPTRDGALRQLAAERSRPDCEAEADHYRAILEKRAEIR
jgi:hypothetical protein